MTLIEEVKEPYLIRVYGFNGDGEALMCFSYDTWDTRKFPVLKWTYSGAWIEDHHGRRRFVNLKAKKQFASLNLEEAIIQWQYRADKRIDILSRDLEYLKNMKGKARKYLGDWRPEKWGDTVPPVYRMEDMKEIQL